MCLGEDTLGEWTPAGRREEEEEDRGVELI